MYVQGIGCTLIRKKNFSSPICVYIREKREKKLSKRLVFVVFTRNGEIRRKGRTLESDYREFNFEIVFAFASRLHTMLGI